MCLQCIVSVHEIRESLCKFQPESTNCCCSNTLEVNGKPVGEYVYQSRHTHKHAQMYTVIDQRTVWKHNTSSICDSFPLCTWHHIRLHSISLDVTAYEARHHLHKWICKLCVDCSNEGFIAAELLTSNQLTKKMCIFGLIHSLHGSMRPSKSKTQTTSQLVQPFLHDSNRLNNMPKKQKHR